MIRLLFKFDLLTQQTPNPEAQFPLSSPPLLVHSEAV